MLNNYLDLKRYIEEMPEGEEKEKMALIAKSIKKDLVNTNFKLQRTLKDKDIAIRLLNASMEDLEQQKVIIEKANERLIEWRKEVEVKNLELSFQKGLVEEKSKELNKNLQELARSYNELEQFSYIASHDLKSPLRTITSFALLLQKRYLGKLDKQADEFINFIVAGTKNMDRVISDLLEYSKVGVKEKDFELVNLKSILELVQFNLGVAIREAKGTVITSNLPILLINKQGVMQVFQNLIGNAIKFRKQEEEPVIEISCEQKGEEYLFTVKDNGVGMEMEYQEKAFLPFQRLNDSDRPGTGMGLAICKKVVTLHGGDIWFESKRGHGTTFFFTLSQAPKGEESTKNQEAQQRLEEIRRLEKETIE